MLDTQQISERLEKLKGYYAALKAQQGVSEDAFQDPIKAMVERYLHLAIESMMDIGELLIASLRLKKPESNKEIFTILAQHHIISHPLAIRLQDAAGFRNILVHDYMGIQESRVYEHFQKDVDDFHYFTQEVLTFIQHYQE